MNCPRCSSTLKPFNRQAVEIDQCLDCQGVWLDRGELDSIIEQSGGQPSRPDERDDADDDKVKPGRLHDDYWGYFFYYH
jgi:uncharacterized protein